MWKKNIGWLIDSKIGREKEKSPTTRTHVLLLAKAF